METQSEPRSGPEDRKTQSAGEGDDERRSADWDVRTGPKNLLHLIRSQIATSLLSFAAAKAATHALGAEGYGGVAALLAASQIIDQIAVEWTNVALWRHGCEEFVATGSIRRAFWARLAILLPNFILVLASSPFWLPVVTSALRIPPEAGPLILAHLSATAVWIHLQRSLQAVKLPRLQAGLLTAERSVVVAVLLALIAAGSASVPAVVCAYIAGTTLSCAAALWRIRSHIFPAAAPEAGLLRRMLSFSAPLIAASLIGTLFTNQVDAFFITAFLSHAALGVYQIAYLLAGTLMQLPQHVGSLLLSTFVTFEVNDQDERRTRYLRDVLPLLCLLWSVACACAAFAGGWLVPLIFGPEFGGVGGILWPLMAAAALAGPWSMGFVPTFSARSATYVGTVAGIVASVANLGLNFLLVPRFGLLGCAWATTIAYGGMMLTAACFVYRWAPSSRAWTLPAAAPTLAGAAWAAWRGEGWTAFLVAMAGAAAIALWRRGPIRAGAAALAASGAFGPVLRLLPGR